MMIWWEGVKRFQSNNDPDPVLNRTVANVPASVVARCLIPIQRLAFGAQPRQVIGSRQPAMAAP
jgi:hypothetical protein